MVVRQLFACACAWAARRATSAGPLDGHLAPLSLLCWPSTGMDGWVLAGSRLFWALAPHGGAWPTR